MLKRVDLYAYDTAVLPVLPVMILAPGRDQDLLQRVLFITILQRKQMKSRRDEVTGLRSPS